MEIVYQDRRIFVVIKPAGVLSTDEPGGMPTLLREYLGDEKACVRTVHRLDQTVSGLMVFARSKEASRILSAQMQGREFYKEYLAVIHGTPEDKQGTFKDLLLRNKKERKTYVTDVLQKDAQEAMLDYQVLDTKHGLSLVKIRLHTGRTHQIRVQFSYRGLPMVGDRKYGIDDGCENIALWSHRLCFVHPETGERMDHSMLPPDKEPWNQFTFG